MQHDYKFILEPTGKPVRKLRPGRRHILAIGVASLVLTVIIGMIPYQAGANRKDSLSQANNLNAITPSSENSQVSRHTLPLPPENSISLPLTDTGKSANVIPAEKNVDWKIAQVKSGDSLAQIFSRQGISANQLFRIMKLGKITQCLKRIQPGDELKFHLGKDNTLLEFIYQKDVANELRITRDGDHFVASEINHPLETRIAHTSGTIENSLFLAGQRAGLSDNMTMQLASIFGWDVDFALDIRQGDHFTVLYEEIYLKDKKIRDGEIIAAEFHNRGRSFSAIRYTDANGVSNYYTPDGHSMRKAFLRTPVEFSRISSRFNLHRKHPLLNRIRAHKGVDYAAPRGTPIKSTGDGRVVFRGRKGGYGNTIVIQHGTVYSTLYAHMSGFNRHVRTGARVKQGQVIGYVGSTGLATGPHLHYEFRVHGVHRNPLTVALPHAQPIPRKYLPDFNSKAQKLVAQLAIVRRNQLAMNP